MDSVIAVASAPPPEPFELPNSVVFSKSDNAKVFCGFLSLPLELVSTKIWLLPLPVISVWGPFKRIPSIDKDNILRLTVSPVVFGSHPSSVYANYEGQELRSISIMYLDSEEFIRKKTINNVDTKLIGLKKEFRKNYNEIASKIEGQLYKTFKSRPSDAYVGNTKFLRNYYNDYYK